MALFAFKQRSRCAHPGFTGRADVQCALGWVAGCALAIQRFRNGRKTPPRLLRMQAEDLVATVFPDQLACAENLSGRRDVPDHPLVTQAVNDCLTDAMDIVGLQRLLVEIGAGRKTLIARDLTEPSPFALQVLNANPYAFLDDAPLEERRTQAVSSRRWLDPATARDLGMLDPEAIVRVRAEVWPAPRDADELHEAILLLGFVSAGEVGELGSAPVIETYLRTLFETGRVWRFDSPCPGWCATERGAELMSIWPQGQHKGAAAAMAYVGSGEKSFAEALEAVVRSRLEMTGPTAPRALEALLGQPANAIAQALTALEQSGIILRGEFAADLGADQWCDRRLLARIHRYTLGRLRQEIEPVSGALFLRFLFDWQHLNVASRVEGLEGVYGIVAQLSGWEAPAATWETSLLAQRVRAYQGNLLDELVRAGRCSWLRLTPKKATFGRQSGTLRNTPLAVMPRADLRAWLELSAPSDAVVPGGVAQAVLAHIETYGASFFDDIVAASGLLPSQCEAALDELAAAGLVTCDSFAGLRALTTPAARRNGAGRRTRRSTQPGIDEAGRWDKLRRSDPETDVEHYSDEALQAVADTLLRRYGVVFRALLERETGLPPWRYLLWTFRRMEAAGELRGGRFVAGHSGEQFALPEAVSALRDQRKIEAQQHIVVVSATDPLNLVGSMVPGERIAALGGNQVAYLDGEFAGMRSGNDFQTRAGLDAAVAVKVRTALVEPGARKPLARRRQWR